MTELTAYELWEQAKALHDAANKLHEAAVRAFQGDLNERAYKMFDRLTDLTDLAAEACFDVEDHLEMMQKREVA